MASKKLIIALVICFLSYGSRGAITNGIDETNHESRNIDTTGVLTSIATNLMSRGFTSNGGSQVVSLNLTNLLVLVLLKALIFAAGSLGAGHWRGGFSRSNDGEESFMGEDEILLYLSYLTGEPGENECLRFVACSEPQQARRYITAGETLLKLSKMFVTEENHVYKMSLNELRQAAGYGISGGDCNRFSCDKNIK
ncbi:uncharacterized protein [Onthophagus taurus]|uniref:uncharacterized protein n=1 Tax=Onthophagus taurus TaxID=166361 RepID=UPI0039BE5871